MLNLKTVFKAQDPHLRLLRLIFIFLFFDSFYMSLSAALAYKIYGLAGALQYTTAQYIFSSVGFFSAFFFMQSMKSNAAWRTLQAGLALSCLLVLGSSMVSDSFLQLIFLALAGYGRGLSWGCRQWLDFHHTKGLSRESYMAYLQAFSILFRVVSPAIAAIVLFWHADDTRYLFLTVGFACLIWIGLSFRTDPLLAPQVGKIQFIKQLTSKEYWEVAPFYCVDGMGTTLRQVLYVSGVVAVVGSLKGFAGLDTLTAIIALCFMLWIARHPTSQPSTKRLAGSLIWVAVSWILLLCAVFYPIALIGFIVLNGIANPLLLAIKGSLVLKGLGVSGEPQNNMLAREVIAVSSRLISLLGCTFIAISLPSKEWGLVFVVSAMLLLLPLEYYFSKRIIKA